MMGVVKSKKLNHTIEYRSSVILGAIAKATTVMGTYSMEVHREESNLDSSWVSVFRASHPSSHVVS